MPGAYSESNHNPQHANILLRLCRTKEKSSTKILELKLLKDEERGSLYENHLNKQLESISIRDNKNKH